MIGDELDLRSKGQANSTAVVHTIPVCTQLTKFPNNVWVSEEGLWFLRGLECGA